MAKRPKNTDPIAMGNIVHGQIIDGKNQVVEFAPGDVVTLDAEHLEPLMACGAVKQLKAETPTEEDQA